MDRQRLRNLLERLCEGVELGDGKLELYRTTKGRFKEEFNLELRLNGTHLLYVKVFEGRGRYYREWVEMFGINPLFFSSRAEEFILTEFSKLFDRLFIEYFEDRETTRELSLGVPPALSRLGFELLKRGYTWFRDWYIPEGLMEGGHKLQAQKPESSERGKKHLEGLREEAERWIGSYVGEEELLKKIIKRKESLSSLLLLDPQPD